MTREENEARIKALDRQDLEMEAMEAFDLLNHPEVMDFLDGTRLEVAHQIQRWGTVHDRAKEPQDWFWLVGYLAGKALRAHGDGDVNKALHHTISSAAVLANWHTQIKLGQAGRFTPGASDLQKMIEETFGSSELGKSE